MGAKGRIGIGRTADAVAQEKHNEQMMKLIRAVHSIVDTSDIDRNRVSQEQVAKRLANVRDMEYTQLEIAGIAAEWICVNRRHMKKYVILYCHGGGFCTGSMQYARVLTNKLAATTSMDVLCFEYRLAPEFPYPAAVEDALAVWDYLMYQGYGSRDIIVAGDSAGGNLALELGLRLKEQGRLLPRGFVLMSPWTDMTLSGKSHEVKSGVDPVLSPDYIERARAAYVGEGGPDYADPGVSPLFGDFRGFPPVYIQAGGNGVLLSDSVNLARHLVRANVSAKIDVYKGMWHVFQMSPFKTAYDAMDLIAEFIFDICR